jgi:hypothetical protein
MTLLTLFSTVDLGHGTSDGREDDLMVLPYCFIPTLLVLYRNQLESLSSRLFDVQGALPFIRVSA